jgi:glycosyltransferase involved in cell wall biosynthesis
MPQTESLAMQPSLPEYRSINGDLRKTALSVVFVDSFDDRSPSSSQETSSCDLVGSLPRSIEWVDVSKPFSSVVATGRIGESGCSALNASVKHEHTLAYAWNEGLARATCPWILFLADGERLEPSAAVDLARAIEADPNADIIYGHGAQWIDGARHRFHPRKPTRHALRRGLPLLSCCVAYRTDLLRTVGGFDRTLVSAPAYDLWIRLQKQAARFVACPSVIASSRVLPYDPSSTQPSNLEQGERRLEACRESLAIANRHFGNRAFRWALRLGELVALRQGISRPTSVAFDRMVLREASQSVGTSPLRRIQLAAYHVANELAHCIKRPKHVLRFCPAPVAGVWNERFGRRIFQLHFHPPRPCILPANYRRHASDASLPSICISTPNLNQGAYIERTIRSVIEQEYPSLEFVVQDGGSRDGSIDVIQRYASQLTAFRVMKDRGQSHAINLGFERTHGQIMAYLNSDDVLLPGALDYVGRYFRDHPEVDVIYGNRLLIDQHDREINRWVLPAHDDQTIRWADYIPQETMFWRRSAWDTVGGVDESFQFAMDWDLILRFRAAGMRFAHVPRYLGAFRINQGQKTLELLATVGRAEMNRLRKRELGFVPDETEVSAHVRNYVRRQRRAQSRQFNRDLIDRIRFGNLHWTAQIAAFQPLPLASYKPQLHPVIAS